MKKLVSIMMAALMVLACCSFAAAEEPIEVEYYMGLGGGLGDVFLGIVDAFNASQSTYHVSTVQFPDFSDTQKAFQAALAAGTPPTLWQSQRNRALIFEDYLEPLNTWYEDAEFNKDDILSGCMSSAYGWDGETIIGVPIYASSQLMYYNIDAFEGYDVDYAFSTYQNLAETVAKIVADPNNSYEIGWMPMWHNDTILECVMAMGGGHYGDDEYKTVNFLDGRWEEVLTQFQEWFKSGLMYTNYGGTGWEYWYANIDDVMNKKAVGYIGSPADAGDLDFTQIAVATRPGWNEYDPQVVSEAHIMVMSKDVTQEQKQGGWEFLKFMAQPENAGKITMEGGYLPVRTSTLEDSTFAAYAETHPFVTIGMEQLSAPTNQTIELGSWGDAYGDLWDNVLIEYMDVHEALEIAQEQGQQAMDDYWESKAE